MATKYYKAPDLYELMFQLPPQSVWRGRGFGALLSELRDMSGWGRDVLDVGCGAGVLSKMIALRNPHARIKAIDSSMEMIEYARRSHGHPSIEYVAQSFWEEAGKFDMVTAAYCWHFFPLDEAAKKLASILSRGGRAFIVATTETPLTKFHSHVFRILSRDRLLLHPPEVLSSSLEKEGFSVRWRMVDRLEGSYLVVARMA